MRKLTLLMFIVLAVAASAIASAAPAAAQTGPSDFGTGSSAVHTRTEGSYAPTRVPVATFADIKLSGVSYRVSVPNAGSRTISNGTGRCW